MRLPKLGLPGLGFFLVCGLAAAPARAADAAGLDLTTATCAAMQREGAVLNPRNLAPAYAGRAAAKSGHARLSADLVKTIADTLRRGCEGAEAKDRKLVDLLAGVAFPAKSDTDHDFATLTCAQLAPLWKEQARVIVPFLVALRDAAANTPLARAGLDQVGENLPKTCRAAGNAAKLVTDLVKTLP